MAYQRIRALLEQLAEYCTQQGIPYRLQQLYDCLATYDRLVSITGSQQALSIAEALIDQARTKANAFSWLETEFRFETYAASIGNRGLAAKADLERQADPDDTALDSYNERMKRFT